MSKYIIALTSILALSAIPSIVSAADVKVQGIINAGVKYTHKDIGKSTFVMAKGGEEDASSRVSIIATEKLTDSLYVRVNLTSALNVDSGSVRQFPQSGSNLFSMESSLSIGNEDVEIQFGRLGALTSTYGTWSAYNRLRMNATRSGLSELGSGMHVNHFVLDNAVLITTKNKSGLFGSFFYSNGDNAENPQTGEVIDQEARYDWSDRRHMMQGLVGYKKGPFASGIIYSYNMPVQYPGSVRKDNEQHVHYTASWDFGSCMVTGTLYWAKNVRSAFTNQATTYFDAIGADKASRDVNKSMKGLEVKSLYMGVAVPMGSNFLGLSAGYGTAAWKGSAVAGVTKTDGDMFRFGGVYRYSLSKSTYLYAAGAYLHGDDLLKAATGHMFSAGMVHKF